jgi:hypothetical protein
LEERGLRLARVSAQDAAANEQMRAGYQQLLKDHPELAGQPNIKEPPRLTEGDLVVVSLYKDEPKLCFLNERTTGDERGEIKKFLGTLNEHNLPDIKGAAHDLRESREREADGRAEPPLGKTAGEIAATLQRFDRKVSPRNQRIEELAMSEDQNHPNESREIWRMQAPTPHGTAGITTGRVAAVDRQTLR